MPLIKKLNQITISILIYSLNLKLKGVYIMSLIKKLNQITISILIYLLNLKLQSSKFNPFRKIFLKTSKHIYLLEIVFLCFFFIACGETKLNLNEDEKESPTFVSNLDPKERAEIVTNPVFEAIVEGKSTEEMDKIISTLNISLLSVNQRGDTPLGTAIQLKLKEKAFFLLEKFSCPDLFHQNNKGESYVYLSAKQGYVELIQRIAGKCYENDFLDGSDYEFSDLDPETNTGEIAIHVALNSTVADALVYEYYRGAFEYLWWTLHKRNHQEESFLHKAIKDGRTNTLEWAVRNYCDKGEWEKSENGWKSIPASLWQHSWNGIQAFTWNFEQLIDYQDKDGNTAFHLVTQALDVPNIRLLSGCRWLDFLIENKEGNIAGQVFLLALDPKLKNHSQNIKNTFIFLVNQETYLKNWIINIFDTVDHQNKNGDSMFHISARLADPFFYNYLKKFANLNLKNNSGETPETIFNVTQSQINRP